MSTPEQVSQLTLEISELRRTTEVGFTRMEGQLALLVQRAEQIDKQLVDHEVRLDALERVKYAAVGAGVVLGGASGALAQMFAR